MSKLVEYDDIFCEVFGVDQSALNDAFTYENVNDWDSVAHMVLVSALEDRFDIMLDTDDILSVTSYEAGKSIMHKYDVIIE